jgi:choline dehydrogenase-like flavoprotein
VRFDYVIIGSGMGGSVLTRRLVAAGASVCLLERGGFVKQEKSNWDIVDVVVKKKYQAEETWYDLEGRPFQPRVYYNVGGSSRFYGAAAYRLRRRDFREQRYADGVSPGWPFPYEELEPYYDRAEGLLHVRGLRGEDPTDPGGRAYPDPPIEHEAFVADLADRLKKQGLRPFHTPLAIDFGPGGRCRKGSPCDGFPCMVRAKGDAENRILRPLLLKKPEKLSLITEARVLRLKTADHGTTVFAALFEKGGILQQVEGRFFLLCAGALNSALILLDSRDEHHPDGLANSSGLVGRNYMCHNNTVLMAFHPFRKNPTVMQKTLSCNDFYLLGGYADGDGGVAGEAADGAAGGAGGNIQLRGKVQPENLRGSPRLYLRLLKRFVAARSADFWIMSEDLPDRNNRIYRDGQSRVRLERKPTNIDAHHQLVAGFTKILKRAGFPFVISVPRGLDSVQHQSGTVRMGTDPGSSVLDPFCRTHDVPNLYVVDGGFFPSSGAVNPALTITAQALRVADHLLDTSFN